MKNIIPKQIRYAEILRHASAWRYYISVVGLALAVNFLMAKAVTEYNLNNHRAKAAVQVYSNRSVKTTPSLKRSTVPLVLKTSTVTM